MRCGGGKRALENKVDLKIVRGGLQLIESLTWSTEQCFAMLRLYSTLIYPSSNEQDDI